MQDFPILSTARYRIERRLGAGGSGAVYKAWDANLQKAVVIKMLFHEIGSEQERDALKNVKSEYLPQVYDFLSEGGRTYTVMEFIEGKSLDQLLKEGKRFSQQQVIQWYGQLAAALTVLHKQKICHRDIKPGNIMLLTNGDVCLIDFNTALIAGNDVKLISRSLGYCSPEQYEIYERHKHRIMSTVPADGGVLPATGENSKTVDMPAAERIDTEMQTQTQTETKIQTQTQTETQSQELANGAVPPTETVHQIDHTVIDWQRSDIYSLGATMYHLLTGVHPPEAPAWLRPISSLGSFSEGIVYVIEQSMRLMPAERFASAGVLTEAVKNIYKHDRRWRSLQVKKAAAALILLLTFVFFAGMMLWGRTVMAQEKEERYYAAVYEIERGTTPQQAYEKALTLFADRIDPYYALAKRLWSAGDLKACQEYIEANLGNIAEFQAIPDAVRSFGGIYYILGNCYYYQSDYVTAAGNFSLALQFVSDNPAYYRDYAIALARLGRLAEAEQALKKAGELNLKADSLNLLKGEIAFAGQAYDSALEYLGQVIAATDDDEIRYRAYHTADEIFRLLGQPERSAALLAEGLERVPVHRQPEMTERLAAAYAQSGETAKAITLFEKLAQSGAPQFHILQDLAILLENQNDFDRAAAVLNQMAEWFPDDYRVPMRQAYLEADQQSRQVNEKRDYTLTRQYYERAAALYRANVRAGEADSEMQRLAALIEQLKANKWFD